MSFKQHAKRLPNEKECEEEEEWLTEEPALHPGHAESRTTLTVYKPRDGAPTKGDIQLGGGLCYSVEWLGEAPAAKGHELVTHVEYELEGAVTLASGLRFKNPLLQHTMQAVQFVRYDEDVYAQLLHLEADNGGVEVDDDKLGPL